MEEWRAIPGWHGYEVSDNGRVRSWKHQSKGRQWAVRLDKEPRILAQENRNGYCAVLLCDKLAGKRHENVNVLVLEAFVGPRPRAAQAAHGDGNKKNNRLWNLRWATPVDNNADKKLHGTYQFGGMIGSAKLSDHDIVLIKKMRASRIRVLDIAGKFGVHRNTITNITTGRAWCHVG